MAKHVLLLLLVRGNAAAQRMVLDGPPTKWLRLGDMRELQARRGDSFHGRLPWSHFLVPFFLIDNFVSYLMSDV
jgi:hypothetical protein